MIPDELAKQIMEIVPKAMWGIRKEVRSTRGKGLTVPQFRTLVHVYRGGGRTNVELAELQGVSVGAMSRMVDGLVKKGLIERGRSLDDRREVSLRLSVKGRNWTERFISHGVEALSRRLVDLEPAQRKALKAGLKVLEEIFQ